MKLQYSFPEYNAKVTLSENGAKMLEYFLQTKMSKNTF